MPKNLSVKNVPDDLAERLQERARGNHRSLQGELMAILEAAAAQGAGTRHKRLPIDELIEWAKTSGLHTSDDSTQTIRELRDSR